MPQICLLFIKAHVTAFPVSGLALPVANPAAVVGTLLLLLLVRQQSLVGFVAAACLPSLLFPASSSICTQ